MSKLRLQNLGKRFGSAVAVAGVDLTLQEGEFISLLGPSGCGKTTTLRMIAGFMPPSEGTVEVDGAVLSAPDRVVPPERRGMSMIFQSYAIWPNMTVAQNVAFGLQLRRLPRAEVDRRVTDMLRTVRLDHLAGRYPSELSGGQQQRVSLARAIVIEPRVLLLDEPLSNLDAALREEMRYEIRRLHDRFRITTVYVTHDQAEALVTSDRIVVMNAGRIEQVDDPVRLYGRPRTRFVAGFIGRTNFLDGTVSGDTVRFPGVTVPAATLPPSEGDANASGADRGAHNGRVSYAVRPHQIGMHRARPAGEDGAAWWIDGRVATRAFLGEYWDYLVDVPGGGGEPVPPLRVSAPPGTMFEPGEAAWLRIDPADAAPVPPAEEKA